MKCGSKSGMERGWFYCLRFILNASWKRNRLNLQPSHSQRPIHFPLTWREWPPCLYFSPASSSQGVELPHNLQFWFSSFFLSCLKFLVQGCCYLLSAGCCSSLTPCTSMLKDLYQKMW